MKKVAVAHVFSAIAALAAGTALHFLYEWSGQNAIASVFGSVNESVWEHLKMVFWPVAALSVLEYIFYGHRYPGFAAIRALAPIIGILTAAASFYTYTGVVGGNFLPLDIATFALGIAGAYLFSFSALKKGRLKGKAAAVICIMLALAAAAAFAYFTFYPPEIAIFAAPALS